MWWIKAKIHLVMSMFRFHLYFVPYSPGIVGFNRRINPAPLRLWAESFLFIQNPRVFRFRMRRWEYRHRGIPQRESFRLYGYNCRISVPIGVQPMDSEIDKWNTFKSWSSERVLLMDEVKITWGYNYWVNLA